MSKQGIKIIKQKNILGNLVVENKNVFIEIDGDKLYIYDLVKDYNNYEINIIIKNDIKEE
jgi:hypothetical protein